MAREETRARKEERRTRGREILRSRCRLVLPLLLYRFNRIQTSVNTSESRRTCVSTISSDVTPPASHPPHPVCARFAGAHRMHLSLAMRPFVPCITGLRCSRRGEKGTERRSLFWTVGYLFACLPKSIQNRGQTAPRAFALSLHLILPSSLPFTLTCCVFHHLFFSSPPPRTLSFSATLKNKDRY